MERTQADALPEDLPPSTADPRHGYGQDSTDAQVRTMLGEMADLLEDKRPDEPITTIGRLALIQATTLDPVLSRALGAVVPEITGSVVRKDFAVRLRAIAEEQ
ncbi:hypothetical protein [Streptomyces sp. NPDC048385]|uniref:hypothetical protein n=1 Tax=unclassified Streptomyces TaxID=2593676 RepID=UPI003428A4F1